MGRTEARGGRRLKVAAAYRRRKYGASHFVPEVSLSGTWLAAAGFAPGDTVAVIIQDGALLITKAS